VFAFSHLTQLLDTMVDSLALSAILHDPSTIQFLEGSDDADLGGIDLSKNPQKSSNGPFVWLTDDRSEASVTFVGKVIYSAIGDKTGPYFSLPDAHWVGVFLSPFLSFQIADV
jgi:hypothetical protein